jgi:hypothetical protein
MALRNGTYVREMDGAKLLYYSCQKWRDPSFALTNNPVENNDFAIVWDTAEQAALYILLMGNLMPGESVEINEGRVT